MVLHVQVAREKFALQTTEIGILYIADGTTKLWKIGLLILRNHCTFKHIKKYNIKGLDIFLELIYLKSNLLLVHNFLDIKNMKACSQFKFLRDLHPKKINENNYKKEFNYDAEKCSVI